MNHLEKLFKKDEGAIKLKKDEIVEAAITALSTVCATDYKATEIEVAITSTTEEGSKFRKVRCVLALHCFSLERFSDVPCCPFAIAALHG